MDNYDPNACAHWRRFPDPSHVDRRLVTDRDRQPGCVKPRKHSTKMPLVNSVGMTSLFSRRSVDACHEERTEIQKKRNLCSLRSWLTSRVHLFASIFLPFVPAHSP